MIFVDYRLHYFCTVLWKHEWKFGRVRNGVGTQGIGKCFHSLNFHECFYNLLETQERVFYFFQKTLGQRKENNLLTLIIKLLILFARTFITSTASACSVFLSSIRNTVFSQSVHVSSQDCSNDIKFCCLDFFVDTATKFMARRIENIGSTW